MTRTIIESKTKTTIIGFDQPFAVIGERINPTGRKKLALELEVGDFSTVEADATGAAGFVLNIAKQFRLVCVGTVDFVINISCILSHLVIHIDILDRQLGELDWECATVILEESPCGFGFDSKMVRRIVRVEIENFGLKIRWEHNFSCVKFFD